MLESATKAVIISEPIRNLVSDERSMLSSVAKWATNPGYEPETLRFTEESLDAFMRRNFSNIENVFIIEGGREKVYVLNCLNKQSKQKISSDSSVLKPSPDFGF